MTRVVVTGATGTIGHAVVDALGRRGDEVVALSRDPERAAALLGARVDVRGWRDPLAAPPEPETLAGADAVVNLMGEPIAQRWTLAARTRIRDSRVVATRNLVEGLTAAGEGRPAVLVSGSAIGYYGALGDQGVDEDAAAGPDYLADVVAHWEAAARAAAAAGVRVVLGRTGVVLSPSGGALARMLPFFRLGLGGPVAGGAQYVSWIHLDDVAGAILHCLDDPDASGPVNLVAPAAVDNRRFSRALGRALHRPAVLPVPAFALALLYGEMAEIVTTGQRVLPGRLTTLGYRFQHPELEPALRDVLGR